MKLKKLYVGAAYYPELWDLSEIEKDVLRCKSLGINLLRIAEFAWGNMEPKEGVIVVEIENKVGEITLNDNYVDLITGRRVTGKITVNPYNVLVLKKLD